MLKHQLEINRRNVILFEFRVARNIMKFDGFPFQDFFVTSTNFLFSK